MNYYHMTSLNNLHSISEKGLIPQSGANSKLIGDEKSKVFFSEGFEGAIALFVDFQIVYDKLKTGQMKVTDKDIENRLLKSECLSDYLGEGVYLRFDGTNVLNERNFENGCTDMTIPPKDLSVCVLKRKNDNSILFSRFEIIKYMMTTVKPEQIKYSGAKYDGAPDCEKATKRIREKVRIYYENHLTEIGSLDDIVRSIGKDDVKRAVRIGACNIYHACVHNAVHEKDTELLAGLYKSAAFTLRAITYLKKGVFEKRQEKLLEYLDPADRNILETRLKFRGQEQIPQDNIDSLTEELLIWSADWIKKMSIKGE